MLASILVGFVPPSRLRLRVRFSLVNVSLVSVPFSLLFFESRLICLHPLSLVLQAIHIHLQRWPFLLLELVTMVVSLLSLMTVVLLMGMAATSFCHVLIATRKTILPTNVGSNSASLLLPKRF